MAEELLRSAGRLNRVIENLLDMSRLNSGFLALKKEWHDVRDLVGVTVKRLEPNLGRRGVAKMEIEFATGFQRFDAASGKAQRGRDLVRMDGLVA